MNANPPLLPWTEGVSVIVPALNHGKFLARLLEALRPLEVLEVLVCDGGSSDDTVAVARNFGAHVLRGQQMSETITGGARHARGTALWFLPPTALPPKMGPVWVLELMRDSVRGGWFKLRYRQGGRARFWASWKANRRASLLGDILLDHGPFIDHYTFETMGGWPAGPGGLRQMMRALRRKGPVCCVPERLAVDLPKA